MLYTFDVNVHLALYRSLVLREYNFIIKVDLEIHFVSKCFKIREWQRAFHITVGCIMFYYDWKSYFFHSFSQFYRLIYTLIQHYTFSYDINLLILSV